MMKWNGKKKSLMFLWMSLNSILAGGLCTGCSPSESLVEPTVNLPRAPEVPGAFGVPEVAVPHVLYGYLVPNEAIIKLATATHLFRISDAKRLHLSKNFIVTENPRARHESEREVQIRDALGELLWKSEGKIVPNSTQLVGNTLGYIALTNRGKVLKIHLYEVNSLRVSFEVVGVSDFKLSKNLLAYRDQGRVLRVQALSDPAGVPVFLGVVQNKKSYQVSSDFIAYAQNQKVYLKNKLGENVFTSRPHSRWHSIQDLKLTHSWLSYITKRPFGGSHWNLVAEGRFPVLTDDAEIQGDLFISNFFAAYQKGDIVYRIKAPIEDPDAGPQLFGVLQGPGNQVVALSEYILTVRTSNNQLHEMVLNALPDRFLDSNGVLVSEQLHNEINAISEEFRSGIQIP